MFHKTKKLDNIIIFHTNTAMRSRLSNQKFFILSMKINLPIFRVLVDRVKAAERQNLRSDIIFDSIDGFEIGNTLSALSFKNRHFLSIPTDFMTNFKCSRWSLFRVISISNSIFGSGNRIGFLNISMIIHEVCVLCLGRNDDGLFASRKAIFSKCRERIIEEIFIVSRCFCYDWLCFVRSVRLRGDFMFCGLFFCESDRDVHSCKTCRLLPFFKIIV